MTVGRGLVGIAVLASVAGMAVSAYLTVVHYSVAPLACSSSGLVDCERVLTSPYAVVSGTALPTSAAGIVWFGATLALALVQLARPRSPALATLQLVWAAIGLAVVLYLVFLEIVRLGSLCAWCTSAHVLVLLIFLLALYRLQLLRSGGEALIQA
jgi:uncharacterized membrane protein